MLRIVYIPKNPMRVNHAFPEDNGPKLYEALREITEVSRSQLEAIKFSQLLEPPGKSSASK